MKKHIKKAAISELPVLLKGIAIIIFTLLSYFAGIVFADYAAGRELNYFADFRENIEMKLAEFKSSLAPGASPKPTTQPTAIPNGATNIIKSDPFFLSVKPFRKGDYKYKIATLSNNEDDLAELGLGENENITSFYYEPMDDVFYYTVQVRYADIWLVEIKKIENFAKATKESQKRYSDVYIEKQNKHGLLGINIIGYENISNNLVVRIGSGDGCGGSGSIWTLSNDSKEKIIDYSVGCAADTGDYKFLTYFNGKILYYEELGQWQEDLNGEKAGDILAYDLANDETEVFLPATFYPEETNGISQSIEDETILIFYSTENLGYDLKTGQFIETQ